MTPEQRNTLRDIIKAAETRISAEFVTVIADSAEAYLFIPTPWRCRQRSRPERKTFGLRNSRTTARRSSSDSRRDLRRVTTTASCAGVNVVCSRCGGWLRSSTLSRCRHLYTVCSVVPKRSAKTRAGSSLACIASADLRRRRLGVQLD